MPDGNVIDRSIAKMGELWRMVFPCRHILLAAAIVFAGSMAWAGTSLKYAVTGFVVIAASCLLSRVYEARDRQAAPAINHDLEQQARDKVLGSVTAGFPNPVIIIGHDGRVLAFNRPAASLAGALRKGEPALLALRMPILFDAIRRAVATGASQHVEYSESAPTDRWYDIWINPVTVGPAETMMLVTFFDLTPLRRVEEVRADFIANASHELRTPLAALTGFIETLQGPARNDPAARERFLGIMQQQANRMARLIDDLLSLSRVELKEHIKPEAPIDIVGTVKRVSEELHMLANDRKVKLSIAVSGEPLIVPGEHDELTRLFENLIENALKYGAAGKRVEVTMSRDLASDPETPHAVVAVRDYGAGIAPEHLPRLTERFYRAGDDAPRADGTGLGLALVKHILMRHRGKLSIDSTLGQGSTFTIRLPLASEVKTVE
jgi:two-component system, OmpR family, phosphate regulon sensor histidine kinase PhoR